MFNIFDYFAKKKLVKAAEQINPYTDEFLNERLAELEKRVDVKRYKHTLGVIEMAEKLATTYDVDKKKARLAAALHDWDKGYNEQEMRERIKNLKVGHIVSNLVVKEMPKVAHGVTAAVSLGLEYPAIPSDVLNAIMYHTTASINMGKLDMVVYVADALDPGRDYPEYNELASMIGVYPLEDLYHKVFAKSVIAVIEKGQTLHPKTAEIWNKNVQSYNERHCNL